MGKPTGKLEVNFSFEVNFYYIQPNLNVYNAPLSEDRIYSHSLGYIPTHMIYFFEKPKPKLLHSEVF